MANSLDPDQTAPIGAVCSGSTLFACILKFASNVRQLFAADDFSRQPFQMHFLGALRVNHCPLGNFACFFFCCVLIFFQNLLFLKTISRIPSECQMVWIQIRLQVLLGLICVKTVCKDY